ncbi:hypothetical protein [Clostridium sp.]|uniref:hypothetical protein n=1 Tax=Clostridium sp. TaxID=1506 RepID=UPI001A4C2BEB|nr:hypothetical protein [Clostridium sp.]MBK5242061.1 hypothetical protein [Clostridium sp.]
MIKILKKIFLLLSSYIPLYILLVGKEIVHRIELYISSGTDFNINKIVWLNSFADWMVTILVAISFVLSVALVILIKRSKKSGKDSYFIVEIENETDKHFYNYLMLYFLPCIGLSISSITDMFILVAIMFIVGIIYVTNDLIYINPMLVFGGYKVFTAKVRYIGNSENDTIKKVIISNYSDIEKLKGKLVKLVKSSTKYTFCYYSSQQDELIDE